MLQRAMKVFITFVLLCTLVPSRADVIQLKWTRGNDVLKEQFIVVSNHLEFVILRSDKSIDPVCEGAVLHVIFFPVLRKMNTQPYIVVKTEYRTYTTKPDKSVKVCFAQGDGVTARYPIDQKVGTIDVGDPRKSTLTWTVVKPAGTKTSP